MDANVAGYLQFYAVLVTIVRPAIVAAVLLGLWLALSRTTLTPRVRAMTWLTVAIPLVLWFVGIWNVAATGVLQARNSAIPLLPLAIIVPVLIGLIVLTRSKRIAVATDAAPPSWLIAIQLYRVIGANFVVLWLYGTIPGVFAVPAGFGDILVGVLAVPVAMYAASGRPGGATAAVAWNVFGIADLVTALTLGFLSSPGPVQLLALDHPNVLTTTYPTVMTPAFAVPLAFILHGLSLWQLWRRWPRRAGGEGLRGGLVHASR
jgi:hypothetical protein